jgi:enoyl-CoA hydratase/carnithine racemase
VTTDEDGPLLVIGVNRPEPNNLWNLDVIQAVSRAYRRLADAPHLRVGVVRAQAATSPRDSISCPSGL